MKSSIFLAAAGALLVVAGPIKELKKREIEIVYDTVYVTKIVTEGTASQGVFYHGQHAAESSSSSSSSSSTTTATIEPTAEATPTQPAAQKPDPPAAPAPDPTPDTQQQQQPPTGDDFIAAALYAHNIHRANHSAPSMEWSSEIAGYAAEVAAKCVFAHDLSAGGGGYGQNLAMWGSSGSPESVPASKVVQQATTNMWYNGEINSYLPSYFGQPTPDMGNFEAWGHVSQVLWASSTKLGCASQFCRAGTMNPSLGVWFTVCDYSPPGNVGGAYGSNVLPSLGQGSVTAPK